MEGLDLAPLSRTPYKPKLQRIEECMDARLPIVTISELVQGRIGVVHGAFLPADVKRRDIKMGAEGVRCVVKSPEGMVLVHKDQGVELPGGKIDLVEWGDGTCHIESPEEAARREAKEEAGASYVEQMELKGFVFEWRPRKKDLAPQLKIHSIFLVVAAGVNVGVCHWSLAERDAGAHAQVHSMEQARILLLQGDSRRQVRDRWAFEVAQGAA